MEALLKKTMILTTSLLTLKLNPKPAPTTSLQIDFSEWPRVIFSSSSNALKDWVAAWLLSVSHYPTKNKWSSPFLLQRKPWSTTMTTCGTLCCPSTELFVSHSICQFSFRTISSSGVVAAKTFLTLKSSSSRTQSSLKIFFNEDLQQELN